MVYAMLYAENGDVVATYDSLPAARNDLAAFVTQHPDLQDEIGLRPYANGRPAGEFKSATDLLGEQLPQQHLASG